MSLFRTLDDRYAPPPAPDKVAWLGEWHYAHRGLHGPGYPENSPAAFALAIKAGVGIECDVQCTGDAQAAVFHDFTLERLTTEKGPVAQRSMERLNTVRLTGGHDTIPSLTQILQQVDGRVPLLIEVKSRKRSKVTVLCEAVNRALESYKGDCAVMSFDAAVPRWFARHAPSIVRGLVVSQHQRPAFVGAGRRRRNLWRGEPDFLAYDVRDLPSRFAKSQRDRGLPVLTWTVKNSEQAEIAAQNADAPIAEGAGLE